MLVTFRGAAMGTASARRAKTVDWATISSLTTGAGTLVLAVATFASVRSANRSARIAERALQVGLRPLLMPSRLEDPSQKIRWVDDHWGHVDGGRALVEIADGNIYVAMSVRNAGSGIAVLQSWHVETSFQPAGQSLPNQSDFHTLSRDLYIPTGDVGFCQAALRDPSDPEYASLKETIEQRRPFIVDVRYGDHEGGQHTISRFTVTPVADSQWLCGVVRHWNLDRPDPR
jgi:hypothetical protein